MFGNSTRALLALAVLACAWPGELRAQSPPPCANPALLTLPYSCEPNAYIVGIQPGSDLNEVLATILSRYGLTPGYIYPGIRAFAIILTPQQVALLRCEPFVRVIEEAFVPFCRPEDPCPVPPSSGPCAAPAALSIPLFSAVGRWALVAMLAGVGALVVSWRPPA